MGAVQTTYGTAMGLAVAGMLADMQKSNIISRTASGNIGFGLPVIRVGDHNAILATQETFEAAAAANATNPPAGATITAAPTVSAGAVLGTYKATVISAGATGAWELEDPNGQRIGTVITGTPYSANGLAFTITDSGADPAVGEQFDIVVTATTLTDDLDVLGIAVYDKTLVHDTPDRYEAYDSVNVLDQGTIWVTAGATVVAGDDVYWNPATSRYTKTTTHLRIPTARFETGGADGGLVIIKLNIP